MPSSEMKSKIVQPYYALKCRKTNLSFDVFYYENPSFELLYVRGIFVVVMLFMLNHMQLGNLW